jgi:hypothetical protein
VPAGRQDPLARLATVAAQHRELRSALRVLKLRRNHLIVEAHRAGIPAREIARVAGLHWTTVTQIVAERPNHKNNNRKRKR